MSNENIAVPAFELRKISFHYPHQTSLILDQVSLSAQVGDKIGIIGDNGCGKSTICKLLLGVVKPSHGSVCVTGHPVRWQQHYPGISYVGDPGYNAEELGLPTHLTVGGALDVLTNLYDNNKIAHRTQEITRRLGLDQLRQKDIRTLSTGERKRLMACFAFSKTPELLILDEPVDGLDRVVRPVILELIAESAQNPHLTLLYIAHSRVEIDTFTNQVYRMHERKLTPELQQNFLVTLTRQGAPTALHQKTGELQGMLENLLDSKDAPIEFDLQVKPLVRHAEV